MRARSLKRVIERATDQHSEQRTARVRSGRVTRAPLLLIGAGGHARACLDVIELEGRYDVVGLLGLPEEVGGEVLGYLRVHRF